MRRSDLADKLIRAGKCPVEALVRLAERAEPEGDLSQAIGAWRSVVPYIYPKPKAVEVAPEVVIDVARELKAVRYEVHQSYSGAWFVDHVERLFKEDQAKLTKMETEKAKIDAI